MRRTWSIFVGFQLKLIIGTSNSPPVCLVSLHLYSSRYIPCEFIVDNMDTGLSYFNASLIDCTKRT